MENKPQQYLSRKTSSKMETANGRTVEKKQSFNQAEPAGPEYININEARENVFTSLFRFYLVFNFQI